MLPVQIFGGVREARYIYIAWLYGLYACLHLFPGCLLGGGGWGGPTGHEKSTGFSHQLMMHINGGKYGNTF
jgi:hypothetical protein